MFDVVFNYVNELTKKLRVRIRKKFVYTKKKQKLVDRSTNLKVGREILPNLTKIVTKKFLE